VRLKNAFIFFLASCASQWATQTVASDDLGVVHEWGTFTSVAGDDGAAIPWQPLSGPSDLPCFVHRLDQKNLKVAEYGTVRMETPVLYFYPLRPLNVSVHVDFPNGRVTEWYPQASNVQPSLARKGWIEWKEVYVDKMDAPLPKLSGASHYYAARDTDAWQLKSEGENEKLLFYRGIGDFGVDLKALVKEDGVLLRNEGADIPEAILFQNQGGKIGFQSVHSLRQPVSISFSSLGGSVDSLRTALEDELMEMGLYRKEAHAMIQTWQDSWFEDGLRVLYIVPRSKVDAVLPIAIHPAAKQLARVFVGRVELLSPSMRNEISAALSAGDAAILKKYDRFLNAFMQMMSNGHAEAVPLSERSRRFLDSAYNRIAVESQKIACAQ
jgi:hypothetical protein